MTNWRSFYGVVKSTTDKTLIGGMRVHKSVRMAYQDLCDDWVASVQSQNVKDVCPCIGKVIPSMKIPEI